MAMKLEIDKEYILKRIIAFVIMIMIIAGTGPVPASDTYTLTVQATVVGTCRFSAPTASTLTLPDITFDAAGNSAASSGSTNITYWCTKGTAPALQEQSTGTDFTGGTQNFARNLTNVDSIPYTLKLTDQGRLLTDTPATLTTITVTADVAAGAANGVEAAAAGTVYSDVVLIDINP